MAKVNGKVAVQWLAYTVNIIFIAYKYKALFIIIIIFNSFSYTYK